MGCKGIAALAAGVVAAFLVAGCGGSQQEEQQPDDVVALINGRPVTIADLETRMSYMPPEAKKELNNPSMLSALVNNEINERVWAEAAREAGLDKTDSYRNRMEIAESAILASLYNEWVRGGLEDEVTDELVQEEYERQQDLYQDSEVHARHILCSTEAKAQEALEAIRGGMPFEQAVGLYTEDSYTKDKSGDLGTLTRGSPLPELGVAPDFFDAMLQLEAGGVGGPIRTRRGYHVVQVLSKTGGGRMSPEAVRAQIQRRLKKGLTEQGIVDIQTELWKKYDVQVFEDVIKAYIGYPVTAEQYVRHIQEATSSGDKIELCSQMVKEFPESKYAPWAQFMHGFVYSEELKNYPEAEKIFRDLIQRYPNSSWADPARWMIENMAAPHAPLRNPDDVKAMVRRSGG